MFLNFRLQIQSFLVDLLLEDDLQAQHVNKQHREAPNKPRECEKHTNIVSEVKEGSSMAKMTHFLVSENDLKTPNLWQFSLHLFQWFEHDSWKLFRASMESRTANQQQ